MTDEIICQELQKVFNTKKYTLRHVFFPHLYIFVSDQFPSLTTFKRMRKQLGFLNTRQQKHTIETISEDLIALHVQFPKPGYFELRKNLSREKNKRVDRIKEWVHLMEPDSAARRLQGQFNRKVFHCTGVNNIWCMDQHDKWKYRFSLCLHHGLDPFTGVIKWMKVWWNNSNPILICKYYLDIMEKTGHGLPLTQNDMGNENGNVAQAQSYLRQWADPSLNGTIQHRWKFNKKNIPSEILWSVFQRTFTFGFEGVLQHGIEQGCSLVFCYLFIPWLQHECDEYVTGNNTHKKRHDQNVARPNGVLILIEQVPERFGAEDFKVAFSAESINEARQLYAPPDHPVLKLVPDTFATLAHGFITDLGNPEVNQNVIWDIYLSLRAKFYDAGIFASQDWEVAASLDNGVNTDPHRPGKADLNLYSLNI
ncbi:hypothetical protein IW261DRAFT_1341519 [Armillaria novae-zelandiae]|uniref:Integrase core domain-containing protein n=1 Tax=Armillaria novae-zelandiae TaxID=153914 RepID=A0AA39NZ83_9AGAR|nr:hypothetical protein IW261DRAFT_1341519 [Armillaria novae-zelandiae]